MIRMQIQTIHAMLFSAATSLNAFWMLNIAKEAYPAVKEFLNFYPVSGPLLGLYMASIAVFCVLFVAIRNAHFLQRAAFGIFIRWYFILSVILFFFAIFPPVYVPIVELFASS